MAIIGILIGLAIFGITLVNRNARDTQRKSVLNDVYAAVTDYYNRTGAYPASIYFGTTAATVGSTTATCLAGSVCIPVPLSGPTLPSTAIALNSTTSSMLSNYPRTTAVAASDKTAYCYKVSTGALGARLETGDYVFAGGTACP